MTPKATHFIYDESGNLSGTIYKTKKGNEKVKVVIIDGKFNPNHGFVLRDLNLGRNVYDSYMFNILNEILSLPKYDTINQVESKQETTQNEQQQIRPITLPILMYEIQLGDFKVVCEDCHSNGKVNDDCDKCNGDGTYFEEKWIVSDNLVKIIKIDRCKTYGNLRYYDRIDSAYAESELYLHFTKEDAKLECERRNRKLNNKENKL